MPVLSGKVGSLTVNGSVIEGFENLTLEYGAEPQEFFAKSGGGSSEAIAGANSGSGSFQMVCNSEDWPTASTVLTSGSKVTMSVQHDAAGAVIATGSVVLGKPSYEVDRSGTPQRATWPFVTSGAWTFPT
jgi:hypothetical protein